MTAAPMPQFDIAIELDLTDASPGEAESTLISFRNQIKKIEGLGSAQIPRAQPPSGAMSGGGGFEAAALIVSAVLPPTIQVLTDLTREWISRRKQRQARIEIRPSNSTEVIRIELQGSTDPEAVARILDSIGGSLSSARTGDSDDVQDQISEQSTERSPNDDS